MPYSSSAYKEVENAFTEIKEAILDKDPSTD
jgi:hypothetical protein